MKLIFDDNKGIKIDMKDYVMEMINDYPDELKGKFKLLGPGFQWKDPISAMLARFWSRSMEGS